MSSRLANFIDKISNVIVDVVGEQGIKTDHILQELFGCESHPIRFSDEQWWEEHQILLSMVDDDYFELQNILENV